jgi:hypothetical protein
MKLNVLVFGASRAHKAMIDGEIADPFLGEPPGVGVDRVDPVKPAP